MASSGGMRLDDLARQAGVATTTVRLYQNRGLLPGPRLVGRTGYYDEPHLARLALIGRLQEQGFSLAAIARVLETWEEGRDLDDLVGMEHELESLLSRRHEAVLSPAELLERFPQGSLTPELVQRASSMGLVEATGDGRFRVADQRFVDTGAALMGLGVPAGVVLDEWEQLVTTTDGIADRFLAVFEEHVLPDDWREGLTGPRTTELARALAQLGQAARQVLVAALDDSLARAGARRLGELTGAAQAVQADDDRGATAATPADGR